MDMMEYCLVVRVDYEAKVILITNQNSFFIKL